jgi:hypothetical protein
MKLLQRLYSYSKKKTKKKTFQGIFVDKNNEPKKGFLLCYYIFFKFGKKIPFVIC